MKKSYVFIFLFGLSFPISAQSGKLKKANTLFANRSYIEAALIYEELEPTQEVLQNLGDSYYFNSETDKAKKTYQQLYSSHRDNLDPEYYFKYAQVLMGSGDYATADEIMSLYRSDSVNTQAYSERLNKTLPYVYEVAPLIGEARSGDFGLSIFNDKVVFSSIRNMDNPEYKWNQKPYLDLYAAEISNDSILGNVTPFSDAINSKTHESSATFSSDGKTMYFSRTNEKRMKIDDTKVAHVKIYKAELIDNEWTNIEALPFSSDLYSVQHPVLSNDDSRLYFSGNLPDSNGSFDLYYVVIAEGNYSQPINLGASINTKHREQFPFIAENGDLYFASDGHQGFGGLDVFRSKTTNPGFDTPVNLGETINSGMDDFSYVLDEENNKGFISSNRDGNDRIYSFIRRENIRTFTVEGVVRDKNSKELLPNTKVTLFNEDGSIVGDVFVGEDAKYVFNTEPDKTYKIEGYRSFYVPTIEEFKTNFDGKVEYNIELEIESFDDAEEIVVESEDGYLYIELENIYFDLNKWDIKPQAARTLDVLVALLNKYPRMEIQLGAHTDSRNTEEYNMTLSLNRANAAMEYLIANNIDKSRLTSKGYGESTPLIKCDDDCTEDEHSINRRCEFLITK